MSLLDGLGREPFLPFRIELRDGSSLTVPGPGIVVVGPDRAILLVQAVRTRDGYYVVRRWRTIAIESVSGFSDIDPPCSETGRSRES